MMTMFQRFARAMKARAGFDTTFGYYYSTLLANSLDGAGVPSAREAQQDLNAALNAQHAYYGSI